MKIIDRYILKSLVSHLLSVTALIVGMVWLSQSLRFLELIVNDNIGLKSYLYLVIFLLPDLLSILLPICLLIAGIQVYQKMIAENEIAVLRSTGHSNFQIAKPLLLLGGLATAFALFCNIFLIPESFKRFRAFEHKVKNELSASMIHPGTFNAIKGNTVYVNERSLKGDLKGVFIHQVEEKNEFSIVAERGYLKREDDKLNLILIKGHRQEWDVETQKLSFFYFENLTYDLSLLLPKESVRATKPYERTLAELLNPEKTTTDATTHRRMIIEGHQRLLTPWLCLLQVLILMGIILSGDLRRRQRKGKILASVIIAALMQVLIISLLNASVQVPFLFYAAYGIMFFGIIGFGLLLKR